MASNYATDAEFIAWAFADDPEAAHATDNAVAGSAEATRISDAVQSAEEHINSYLGKRYDVPIDVTSDDGLARILKRATFEIGKWFLLGANVEYATDDIKKLYDDRVAWLQAIADGVLVLPGAEEPPSATRVAVVQWGSRGVDRTAAPTLDRVFTRDTQSGL
jgi:phage gp36-like protein